MKKIFFTCLLTLSFISSMIAQIAINQTDVNGKKQGLWEEKTSGNTSKGTYFNNQKDGSWTTHTGDGKLIRIECYKQGLLDGITIDIDPRGYLQSETYYVNNLIEGTAKKFFYGSNPASTIDYLHGKIHGVKKIYYENSGGKLLEESVYKDDLKNGLSSFYSHTGDLIAEFNYVNNILHGIQKEYYAGKKLMSEQAYTDNLEHGIRKEYYENGTVKLECVYIKGVLNGSWKENNSEGKLSVQGNYLNGEKNGKWVELDNSGQVIKTTQFVNGQVK